MEDLDQYKVLSPPFQSVRLLAEMFSKGRLRNQGFHGIVQNGSMCESNASAVQFTIPKVRANNGHLRLLYCVDVDVLGTLFSPKVNMSTEIALSLPDSISLVDASSTSTLPCILPFVDHTYLSQLPAIPRSFDTGSSHYSWNVDKFSVPTAMAAYGKPKKKSLLISFSVLRDFESTSDSSTSKSGKQGQ